jgi:hypothetical protein
MEDPERPLNVAFTKLADVMAQPATLSRSLGGNNSDAKEAEGERTQSLGGHSNCSQACDAVSQTPVPHESEAMREVGHLPPPAIEVHGAIWS